MDDNKYVAQTILEGFFSPDAAIVVVNINAYPITKAERKIVSDAVEQRKLEFSSGRWCAREALKMIDIQCSYIGVGELHQPLWPQGVIGSISHDIDLAVAVVVLTTKVAWMSIGVDVINLSVTKNSLSGLAYMFIYDESELELMTTLSKHMQAEMVLFSLKECAVKALSETCGKFMDCRELRFMMCDRQIYCYYQGVKYGCEVLVENTESFLITAIKVYPPLLSLS